MRKFRIIAMEESSNPAKAGYFRLVISNGKKILYGFYDIVDETAGITERMEDLCGLTKESQMVRFHNTKGNWNILIRQLNKMRRHIDLSLLDCPTLNPATAVLNQI